MAVTEIDEVLVPNMQASLTILSKSPYSVCLASRFSTIVSTTSAASARSLSCSTAIRRWLAASANYGAPAFFGHFRELSTNATDCFFSRARSVVEQLNRDAPLPPQFWAIIPAPIAPVPTTAMTVCWEEESGHEVILHGTWAHAFP